MDFSGRVAVVTGAGNGLGRAHAIMLASRGCKVVVNDLGGGVTGGDVIGTYVFGTSAYSKEEQAVRSSAAPADKVVAEIKAMGGEAVANYESVENGASIVKTAIDTWGRIDICVLNAGIVRSAPFKDYTDDDWHMLINVHLHGSYSVAHAAWPYMLEANYGRLVFTSSPAGLWGMFAQAAYSAAKNGVVGLAKTLSAEGRKRGIKANCIAPYAMTRMTGATSDSNQPTMDPKFVSALVTFLSHESCPASGCVYECGDGWYGKVEYVRANGHLLSNREPGDVSPEMVRDNFAEIDDMDAAGAETMKPGNTTINHKISLVKASL